MAKLNQQKLDEVLAAAGISPEAAEKVRQANSPDSAREGDGHGSAQPDSTPVDVI